MTNQRRDKDGKYANGPVSPPSSSTWEGPTVQATETVPSSTDQYDHMLQTVKSLAGTPVSSSHTPVERPLPAEGMSLYWNETRPYGAPKVTVRGGATRIPEVKDILKENGFMWDPPAHAWIGYHYGSELQEILSQVEENTGASVQEKVYDHPSEDTDAMLTDMRENRTESAPAGEQRDTGGLPF